MGLGLRRGSNRAGSVNRRIFAALLTVGGLNCLVKPITILKEAILARQFGVGDGLDAFLVAYMIPGFLTAVIAGSFSVAFIPTYLQLREEEGSEAADRLLSSVVGRSLLLLSLIALALGLAAPYFLPLMASSFAPAKLALTRSLFWLMLPLVILSGILAIWGAVLNAREQFALPAATPAASALITGSVILAWGRTLGVHSLVLAMILGALVEGWLLAYGLHKCGVSIRPRWGRLEPAFWQVARQYLPAAASMLVVGSSSLVDQSMAAGLGAGGVSVLTYANKVVSVVLGVVGIGLGTAVLPYFSRLAAVRDWDAIRRTLQRYSLLILAATIPLTALFWLLSELVVRILFQGGAFAASSTPLVAQTQRYYLLQVPFFAMGILMVRLFSALKANRVLFWGSLISVSLNAVLDLIFGRWLGVPGIALSSSVVQLLMCVYCVLVLRYLLGSVCQRDVRPVAPACAAQPA